MKKLVPFLFALVLMVGAPWHAGAGSSRFLFGESDLLLVGDIANHTGDLDFEDSLREAIHVAYLRGEAELALQRVHLGKARADAAANAKTDAKIAYQQFFTFWKDADLDIPLLKQAKLEAAKLHSRLIPL
jgi:hypothetical protein